MVSSYSVKELCFGGSHEKCQPYYKALSNYGCLWQQKKSISYVFGMKLKNSTFLASLLVFFTFSERAIIQRNATKKFQP
jgi:hypothetical protein